MTFQAWKIKFLNFQIFHDQWEPWCSSNSKEVLPLCKILADETHLTHPCSWHSAERSQQVGFNSRRRLKYKHPRRSQQVHRNLL